MLRTAARLRDSGIATASLDLTAIGTNLTPEQWYSGLVIQMGDRLGIDEELLQFWEAPTLAGPMQRWLSTIRRVVLPLTPGRLVIFVDEIDAVRSLSFTTDEFFAGIRECYNLRQQEEELKRLTFCLLGVAAPSDLVRDTRTTPFNVGRRVELTDFREEEGLILADGLAGGPNQQRATFKRIIHWTGGHPYLTQRACQIAAERRILPGRGELNRLLDDLFFSKRARECDDNLIFVRERILRSGADLPTLLNLYSKVRKGKPVPDDDSNSFASVLKLSGIAAGSKGKLRVRNPIYGRVFDAAWIASNLPDFEIRRQREAYRRGMLRTALVSAIILLVFAALAGMAIWQRNRALTQASVNHRLLYLSQMKVAAQEFAKGDIGRVDEVLAATQPSLGEEDLRGIEWFLLSHSAHEGKIAAKEGRRIVNLRFRRDGELLIAELSVLHGNREYLIKLYDSGTGQLAAPFAIPAGKDFPCVVFSSDPRHIVTDSPNNAPVLWDIQLKEPIASFREHKVGISRIAISPNERYIASGDIDGVVSVEETASGRTIASRALGHWISGLAFSPDERLLAVANHSPTVRVIDTAAGADMKPLQLEEGLVAKVFFSPDGRTLETATRDGRLLFWDIRSQRQIPKPVGHSNEIWSFAFSPDGRTLATGSIDRTVKLWDMASKKELRAIRGHGSEVDAVAWSSDGSLLATGDDDGVVKIWDAFPRTTTLPAEPVASYLATVFSSGGELLGLGTNSKGQARVWDLSSGRQVTEIETRGEKLQCAAFSKDAASVATGGMDREVRAYQVTTGKLIGPPISYRADIHGLVFSPDGTKLVAGDAQGNVELWEVGTGREVMRLSNGSGSYRAAFSFSPDGRWVASAERDGSVRIWDVESRRLVTTFADHTDTVRVIAFSPDGKLVATAGDDNKVSLRSIHGDGESRRSVRADEIERLAFTGDGKRLITGGQDGSVKLWDVIDLQEVITLRDSGGAVTSIAFSRDGDTLAVSGDDGVVKVWQAAKR